MDDFIAVVNTAVAFLQHKKFQKALVVQGALDGTLAVLVDSYTRFDSHPSIPPIGSPSPSDQDDAKALSQLRENTNRQQQQQQHQHQQRHLHFLPHLFDLPSVKSYSAADHIAEKDNNRRKCDQKPTPQIAQLAAQRIILVLAMLVEMEREPARGARSVFLLAGAGDYRRCVKQDLAGEGDQNE